MNTAASDAQRRRSIRLKAYDYSRAGAYFVTICTHARACVFGDVVDGAMVLNDAGRVARDEWRRLPERFTQLSPDAFVVMPNHIHGIIFNAGAQFIAPARVQGSGQDAMKTSFGVSQSASFGVANRAPTVGEIVRAFKAVTTRRIRQSGIHAFAWQRNYYEHIIRDEASLLSLREYITNNPLQWALDCENPANG